MFYVLLQLNDAYRFWHQVYLISNQLYRYHLLTCLVVCSCAFKLCYKMKNPFLSYFWCCSQLQATIKIVEFVLLIVSFLTINSYGIRKKCSLISSKMHFIIKQKYTFLIMICFCGIVLFPWDSYNYSFILSITYVSLRRILFFQLLHIISSF